MNIQQKMKDLAQLIQKDRKAQVIAGGLVFAGLFLLLYQDKPYQNPRPLLVLQQPEESLGATTAQEIYEDIRSVVVDRIDAQEETLVEIKGVIRDTHKRIENNERQAAEIFETIISRIETPQAVITDAMVVQGEGRPVGGTPLFPEADPFEGDTLDTFFDPFNTVGTVTPPEIATENSREAFIAPGNRVRVKIMSGVQAPTEGAPYPVLLKVISDVYSPDGGSLPIGEADIIAAAQGFLTNSRVLFRLTSLTMRLPDGELINLPVDGWIAGEDGMRGLKGVPIDPLGNILVANGIAGVVAGGGNALKVGQQTTFNNGSGTTTALTGNMVDAIVGGGINEPANLYVDIIKERVEDVSPLIEIFSGREATAIFSTGTRIPRLYEMLESGV